MAKLTDIKALIEASFQGDSGRANSLVKIARQGGVFTTGGRGQNAAEMVPNDYAHGLLICLFLGAPTKVMDFINEVANLPLFTLGTDPSDGGAMRATQARYINVTEPDIFGNPNWPPHFDGVEPSKDMTLAECLSKIFENAIQHPKKPIWNRFDEITYENAFQNESVALHLTGPGFENRHDRIFDESCDYSKYQWRLTFENRTLDRECKFMAVESRRLFSDTLQAFTDLAQRDLKGGGNK